MLKPSSTTIASESEGDALSWRARMAPAAWRDLRTRLRTIHAVTGWRWPDCAHGAGVGATTPKYLMTGNSRPPGPVNQAKIAAFCRQHEHLVTDPDAVACLRGRRFEPAPPGAGFIYVGAGPSRVTNPDASRHLQAREWQMTEKPFGRRGMTGPAAPRIVPPEVEEARERIEGADLGRVRRES